MDSPTRKQATVIDRRYMAIILLVVIAATIALWPRHRPAAPPEALSPARSQTPTAPPRMPTASESLLKGYGDAATAPIDDLRMVHHVISGYFSVIKDPVHQPIGGNADLAAALRGENPNREVFIPAENPLYSAGGLLVDRWGTPFIVHPEGWRQIELRSAGPDKKPYSADDLVITPAGIQPR